MERLSKIWTTSLEVITLTNLMKKPNTLISGKSCKLAKLFFLPIVDSNSRETNLKSSFQFNDIDFSIQAGFALTAFNPPGITRNREDNLKKNLELFNEIKLLNKRPTQIYPSFGINIKENWREDGFLLMFNEDERNLAREEVLKLASKFDQGGIFEYKTVRVRDDDEQEKMVLIRKTLFVEVNNNVESETIEIKMIQEADMAKEILEHELCSKP